MKRLCLLFLGSYSALFSANPDTFSRDRLVDFYDQYLCEEKNILSEAGLTPACYTVDPLSPLPDPPPAVPVPNPMPPNPSPTMGLLPFVVVNNSGLPDNQVFVLVQGRVPTNGPQVFVDFAANGTGTLHLVTAGENGSTYTHPLSFFPAAPGGGHEFYLPNIDSFLVLISLNTPLNIPVLAGPKIADPAFNDPNDPYMNYAINWDQVEGAYVPTGTNISVDATAVSFFSIPMYIYLSTPDPGSASNCGLTQSRRSIMSYLQSSFSTVPPAAEQPAWKSLVVGSGSTIYRAISPGKAIAGGFFNQNYLDDTAAYGYSFIHNVWSGANSFYRMHPGGLSIEIPGGKTYTGTVQSDSSILFISGSDQVIFAPPSFGPPYTSSTSYNIFSGLTLVSSATNGADGIQVSKAFEEAIIAGIVPTTSLINATTSNTLSVYKPYYRINPNLTGAGPVTGPWYDLYSASLHACGLIYTFAFDEPLWPEVLLNCTTLQPSTYVGITIGNCSP